MWCGRGSRSFHVMLNIRLYVCNQHPAKCEWRLVVGTRSEESCPYWTFWPILSQQSVPVQDWERGWGRCSSFSLNIIPTLTTLMSRGWRKQQFHKHVGGVAESCWYLLFSLSCCYIFRKPKWRDGVPGGGRAPVQVDLMSTHPVESLQELGGRLSPWLHIVFTAVPFTHGGQMEKHMMHKVS